jgi:rubrerythrin
MKYQKWIERERRIRIKILLSSTLIKKTKTYFICQDCGELCLCHEKNCPNCNSIKVESMKLTLNDKESLENHIRCKFRFNQLQVN